jgi:hypothetical protein
VTPNQSANRRRTVETLDDYGDEGAFDDHTGQRPHAERRGLARAPMLTSLLAVRQEPLGRSVEVHTMGWRLSPRLWKSRPKQVDGGEKPVGEA